MKEKLINILTIRNDILNINSKVNKRNWHLKVMLKCVLKKKNNKFSLNRSTRFIKNEFNYNILLFL